MRTTPIALAMTALFLASCSAVSPDQPSFNPDQQRYLELVHQSQNELIESLGDPELIELGDQVCAAAVAGTINDATVIAAESLAQSVYDSVPFEMVGDYVSALVISSLNGLCPDQAYKLQYG